MQQTQQLSNVGFKLGIDSGNWSELKKCRRKKQHNVKSVLLFLYVKRDFPKQL